MKVKVSKLKHHPLNEKIYTLSGIESLMESIKEVGLLEPPTIDQDFQVISGNRRFESVTRLGWKEIDVHQIHVKKGDEVLTLIHFNRQRIKTTQEQLNEYFQLELYHKKKGVDKGKRIRSIVSDEIKVTDGQLARILYVHKRNPEYIKLVDQGILSVNQAYLTLRREEEEQKSKMDLKRYSKFKIPSKKNEFTFYKKSSNRLLEIKDESIQCIFTSPPFGLGVRDYSTKVTLGTENSIEEYAENLSNHLINCERVLSKSGSFYLEIGDVYKDGELQNAPHKVLFKLLEKTKFKLRSTIIFRRSNPKPSSIKNRPTNSYSYLFHLVKSMEYDYQRMTIPISGNTKPSHPPRHRSKKGSNEIIIGTPYIPSTQGKNLPDYWDNELIVTSVANQSLNYGSEHPAMYHPSLVTIPVLQTCVLPWLDFVKRENITNKILDPFAGGLNTYKSMKWINETYGTNLEFIGYDLKKYF
jgi:DNA modification methylase/ParB-like chromosome segregation protein Spo0J